MRPGCPWSAFMTYGTRSRAACAPPACPPKIAKRYSAMPIIRWPALTRVPMSAICSSRPISFLIEVKPRPCYASPYQVDFIDKDSPDAVRIAWPRYARSRRSGRAASAVTASSTTCPCAKA
jgi:hypothetical protein